MPNISITETQEISKFKEDIQTKIQSIQDSNARMDFMASFHTLMNSLNDKNPYKSAWEQIATDYFVPILPNGRLDKTVFEERLDELAQWQEQKMIEAGNLIQNIPNIHSDAWFAKNISTSKPASLYTNMRVTLFFTLICQSPVVDIEELMEQEYSNLKANEMDPSHLLTVKMEQLEAKQNPVEAQLYKKGNSYISDNNVGLLKDKAIAKAATEEEKAALIKDKKKWKEQQKTLISQEQPIPSKELGRLQQKTAKEICDTLDLSFLSNANTIKNIREEYNKTLNHNIPKGVNMDFLEQTERTMKLLDETGASGSLEYMAVRNNITKLQDMLYKYGASPEHTAEISETGKKLAENCNAYMKKYPDKRSTDKGNQRRNAITQLYEAANEKYNMRRENAWQSGMENFSTLANELNTRSGQRKGFFGGKSEDSDEYKSVLNAVNSLRDNLQNGSLRTEDFRKLSDEVKKACDNYLTQKNPHSEEGKERYALVQNLWNASSRLSEHYLDTVTKNPFNMSEDLHTVRNTIAGSHASERQNTQELREAQNTNDTVKTRNSISNVGKRPLL